MISSGNVEWPRLIAYGESVGLGVAQAAADISTATINST